MKKRIVSLLVMSLAAEWGYAASQTMVWGDSKTYSARLKGVAGASGKTASDYQLRLKGNPGVNTSNHGRYQIMYKGVPVWGHQLVFHGKSGKAPAVTGIDVKGIENDLSSMDGKLTAKQAEDKVLATVKGKIKFKTTEKVIYIDNEQKAHLSYHLAFYTHQDKKPISAPNYLIDANSGEVLKQWNAARQERIGQGLGGNSFPLPYRSGMFQHGDAIPGVPSLGKFDVTVKDGFCHVENDAVRVVNLFNLPLGYEAFPIGVEEESQYKLGAFVYPCDALSFYLNYTDGSAGPVNYSFSPVNDTMYFAQQTLDMYEQVYGVSKPLGDDLPVRAYTHLGAMDNAFAIPTIRYNGELLAHQQIIIGNGNYFLTAPAQAVIGHELSHNFTELNSGLFYDGQSGGINESFSDMAAIALQDFLRRDYPWYWDGEDWTIGREAVLGGEPLRYMDDPTKDGISIAHADDYSDELDVHETSGVFNKAFYLLAHKPGWSIQQAFQVMIDANQNYWSPIAYYDFAACGVIQAAKDRDLDETAVIEAFDEVGVHCPV
ncbi:M4 family metallopeptidase [Legionella spiritensis]|uniref:Neutral metalloproteinase n=1 Tax=Legionella spiritensis TaxID=452 RepID=A0A0W0ZB18_LEGSP|nr:M4 family metallopeptidase [Legionella spiritensis]KTD66347.1 virulence metalloprotease [Legionella spiritensis]SNV48737.1 virulence metalloprotease [Legionella spiritensis]